MNEWFFDSTLLPFTKIWVPEGCTVITTRHGTYPVHRNWLRKQVIHDEYEQE